MTTTIDNINGNSIISITGRLDSVTSPKFDSDIAPIYSPDQSSDIIVDCAALEYISSAGLRSLITLLKKSKAAGRTLELHNLPASIRTIFDMTGFTSIFTII